jgi:membrane-associated phospholipid phosphatase
MISLGLKKAFSLTCVFLLTSVCSFSQNWDIDHLRPINHNESTFKNNFCTVISNSVIIFNVAAPLGVFTAGVVRHDKHLKEDALYMVGGYVVSSIVTQGMKVIIQRPRPYITYPDIIKRTEGGGYSMPSGHTSAAFCTATSLSLLFPKWYVIAPCYLYAASVGYARMYQGVHYPTDVMVGALVGAGSAWLAFEAEKWMDKKKAQKNATAYASF